MECKWEDGSEIAVRIDEDTAVLRANREGLLSLSKLCAALANETPGSHLHLDAFNALEDGSAELILEKARGENGV